MIFVQFHYFRLNYFKYFLPRFKYKTPTSKQFMADLPSLLVLDSGFNLHVFFLSATHQDSVLAVLPFFHIFAASVVMFHKMSLGCKIVTLPKLQPELYFNTILKYKINKIFVAPPLGKFACLALSAATRF